MPRGKHPDNLTQSEARLKISNYCAYQERSPKQVVKKLSEYGISSDQIESVFNWAVNEKFVDEYRFAETYVNGKFKLKKWGKYKIKTGLMKHEISTENIQLALETIDQADYWATLENLAIKKLKLLGGNNDQKWIKLTNFLIGKGFEHDLVFELTRKMQDE